MRFAIHVLLTHDNVGETNEYTMEEESNRKIAFLETLLSVKVLKGPGTPFWMMISIDTVRKHRMGLYSFKVA